MTDDDRPDLSADDVLTWDRIGYPKPARGPLSKRVLREAYVELVVPRIQEIVLAQVAKAIGVSHLIARDVDGKFTRVTDMAPELLDALLKAGGTRFEVHLRDPDMNAITDLLNRVMDRPKEQPAEHKHTVGFTLEDLVAAATKETE